MLIKQAIQEVRAIPLNSIYSKQEKRVVPINTNEFRYLRFRAIGNMEVSGFNGNLDGFPYEYFEDDEPGYGYKSFRGKRAHHEHNSNLGVVGSIGDLPDAYLNKFNYPEDVPEKKWASLLNKVSDSKRIAILQMPGQKLGDIEVLMRIDTTLLKSSSLDKKVKQALERIVRMIDTGQSLSCSMGTNVQYSVCSACGNEARFASDYCNHLSKRKGALTVVTANELRDLLDKGILRPEWLKHITTSKYDAKDVVEGISNRGVPVKNGELNHKLSFFELSIVGIPAFLDAKMLEKLAKKAEGDRKTYLDLLRKEIGDDNLLDIYGLLQDDGIISSQCQVY
jgi:hypothetical protein